jgi:hypothetical protein
VYYIKFIILKNNLKELILRNILRILFKSISVFLPDCIFLRIKFLFHLNELLNLKNPKTFNEKLQWLKLYDRNPEYTKMVDKYEVREHIKDKLGEEFLIPLLGVYESFDEINFDELPNQFVLKTTHDSGGVVICSDKSKLDIIQAKKKINKSLKRNYYWHAREWPYKNVKPRIVCEKFISDNPNCTNLTDYKFYCFNGFVDSVMLCIDREKGEPKFYFFNKRWELKRYNILGKNAPKDFTIPKPRCIDKMFDIAENLSKNIPFVRIDMYISKEKIYFGEFTFYPSSGMDPNYLTETDILFGDMININSLK